MHAGRVAAEPEGARQDSPAHRRRHRRRYPAIARCKGGWPRIMNRDTTERPSAESCRRRRSCFDRTFHHRRCLPDSRIIFGGASSRSSRAKIVAGTLGDVESPFDGRIPPSSDVRPVETRRRLQSRTLQGTRGCSELWASHHWRSQKDQQQ
jgi:hypothetical protein